MKCRTEADFDGLVRAAKLIAVVAAWNELGLWDRLAAQEAAVDLAKLPGNPRALLLTAPALAHAGLLDGGGGRWALSARARELHACGELPGGASLEWLLDLSRMADVLREGGPVRGANGRPKVTSGGVRPDDPEASRRFLEMLYRRSEAAARTTATWIAERLPERGHILDLGGGHGRYSEALVAQGFEATLFDLPLVVDLARERHGEHISYRAGDFHADDLGGPYDAALLSNIIHSESDDANAALMSRLFAALRPGGWVVVKDMFLDEQHRDPEPAVFFATTMLFYTAAGASYGLDDLRRWCAAAGFAPATAIGLDTHSLAFARRPV
jgi:SAM-dependent methyltransferase